MLATPSVEQVAAVPVAASAPQVPAADEIVAAPVQMPPPADAPPVAPPTVAAPPPAVEGEIVVQAREGQGEPIEQLNVKNFEVTQKVDEAVFGPVARAYGDSVPRPIRKGLRNFLTNLREPIVAANFVLQLKIGKAAETLGRFAINSTLGVAGLFDQAKRKPFNLPRRRNSFANTLGFYGVKPGPFFYFPLIGPTTLRDFAGNIVDQIAAPHVTVPPFDKPEYIAPIGVLSALDARNEFDEEIAERRAGPDPYGATRRLYLERRQAEIDALRGKRARKPPAR